MMGGYQCGVAAYQRRIPSNFVSKFVGSTDDAAVPGMATGTVVGSLPVVPGGFEIRTQVPSEFIITGG